MARRAILGLILFLAGTPLSAQQDSDARTVIGPSNLNLYDGANAMLAGDFETGVRLTVLGLQIASSERERKSGHSNLCAGYLMLQQYETALWHCNWVLERDDRHWRTYNNRALVYLAMDRFEESEADIKRGQGINPRSEKLKEVKGLYLDEVEPVTADIVIDDRRNKPDIPVASPEP